MATALLDDRAGAYGQSHRRNLAYLPFVDGLRALSIVAVVGYHVGVPGFSGGYVGVDVFFVISGFLIIGQIRSGIEAGRFSLCGFYARRSLRILPPYLVMLAVVFAAAALLLPTPGTQLDFLGSAALSPLMLSNVFFYARQGYFDLAADLKPLLHTWTLSVEEQFYVAAPLLLLAMARYGGQRLRTPALLAALVLGAASLAGAIIATTPSRNAAFYLPHWRAWEFIAGGLAGPAAVWIAVRLPRPAVAEILGWLGLGLIVAAVIGLQTTTPYPSWRAIVPVAGATLCIIGGLARADSSAARLLSWRPVVAIGLVSYSWYLWHWPILSFLRLGRFGEHALLEDLIGGGVVAFGCACASYLLIERKVRAWRRANWTRVRPGRIVAGGAAACLAAALLGLIAGGSGYAHTRSVIAARYDVEGHGTLDNGCRITTASRIDSHCLRGRIGLIFGDSASDAMATALSRHAAAHGAMLVSTARGGCDPMLFAPSQRAANRSHGCANLLPVFEQVLKADPPAFVVIYAAWADRSRTSAAVFAELIGQFDPDKTRILLIAPTPTFRTSSLECLILSDRAGTSHERCAEPRAVVEASRAQIVAMLKSATAGNVRYIDPIDLFCDARTCRPVAGRTVLVTDATHISPAGTDRIAAQFAAEMNWLMGARPD